MGIDKNRISSRMNPQKFNKFDDTTEEEESGEELENDGDEESEEDSDSDDRTQHRIPTTLSGIIGRIKQSRRRIKLKKEFQVFFHYNLRLKDVLGVLVELSKHEIGTKFIVANLNEILKSLEEAKSLRPIPRTPIRHKIMEGQTIDDFEQCFNIVVSEALELSLDRFAHKIVTIFLDSSLIFPDLRMRERLIDTLSPRFDLLVESDSGRTVLVQMLQVGGENVTKLIDALSPHIDRLLESVAGRTVLFQMFQVAEEETVTKLMNWVFSFHEENDFGAERRRLTIYEKEKKNKKNELACLLLSRSKELIGLNDIIQKLVQGLHQISKCHNPIRILELVESILKSKKRSFETKKMIIEEVVMKNLSIYMMDAFGRILVTYCVVSLGAPEKEEIKVYHASMMTVLLGLLMHHHESKTYKTCTYLLDEILGVLVDGGTKVDKSVLFVMHSMFTVLKTNQRLFIRTLMNKYTANITIWIVKYFGRKTPSTKRIIKEVCSNDNECLSEFKSFLEEVIRHEDFALDEIVEKEKFLKYLDKYFKIPEEKVVEVSKSKNAKKKKKKSKLSTERRRRKRKSRRPPRTRD